VRLEALGFGWPRCSALYRLMYHSYPCRVTGRILTLPLVSHASSRLVTVSLVASTTSSRSTSRTFASANTMACSSVPWKVQLRYLRCPSSILDICTCQLSLPRFRMLNACLPRRTAVCSVIAPPLYRSMVWRSPLAPLGSHHWGRRRA
jgi:hypothetical protein